MSSHRAAEESTLEQVLEKLPDRANWARTVLGRLRQITPIPESARVLDAGAASGAFVAACNQMGLRAEGVEPWARAREIAALVAQWLGVSIPIVEGRAEALPYEAGVFDVVHALNVMEHVIDAAAAMREAFRVLKPGGVLWFNSASAMCPRQDEIAGFPLFGWYPDPLKLRIMRWAQERRPELIGHTTAPAIKLVHAWESEPAVARGGSHAGLRPLATPGRRGRRKDVRDGSAADPMLIALPFRRRRRRPGMLVRGDEVVSRERWGGFE